MAAEALAALDSGLAQRGTISAQNAQLVQLLGADTTGWTSVLWSIRSYPEAFALPGGWSLNTETGAYESTATRPPGFHLPSGTEPAKLDVELTVDGVTDSSLRIVVPSKALRLVDTALAESTVRSGHRGFARDVNRNWRLIERAFAALTSTSGPVDTVDYQTFQAETATPAWYVVGSFRPTIPRRVKLRVIGCVSSGSLTLRARLFDLTVAPPAPAGTIATITGNLTATLAESTAFALAADHTYQFQVEVTGGNNETDFGAVHLVQPVDQ